MAMSWWMFGYLLVAIAMSATAANGMSVLGKKLNFWAVLLMVALWPLSMVWGVMRIVGEKNGKAKEAGTSVRDGRTRH
jgi:uncharacterized Tic20 family protein